jgi:hypothetical protein
MVRVYDLAFAGADSGHAVGASGLDGRISFTTNSGTNWAGQSTTGWPFVRAIDFFPANPDVRTIVGDSGLVLHTTNLGLAWVQRTSGTNRDLEGITYASQSDVYAVGDLGTILRSTDGTATWSQQLSGTSNTLNDVAFISRDTGFAVGGNGLILATTTGGLVSVDDPQSTSNIPDRPALAQNFPNPFNPRTTILFTLPYSSFVTLKVFDILGREVAALLDGTRPSGRHSIQWNAAGMPSGMYFCKFRAQPLHGGGVNTETRKLVLLK